MTDVQSGLEGGFMWFWAGGTYISLHYWSVLFFASLSVPKLYHITEFTITTVAATIHRPAIRLPPLGLHPPYRTY